MAKKNGELSITSELRTFLRTQPFKVFDIRTTDGDTFHVFHPDYCMISPRGDIAVVYEKADEGHRVINLRQVVSLEPSRHKKGLFSPPKK
jgi:hypothetical protein